MGVPFSLCSEFGAIGESGDTRGPLELHTTIQYNTIMKEILDAFKIGLTGSRSDVAMFLFQFSLVLITGGWFIGMTVEFIANLMK